MNTQTLNQIDPLGKQPERGMEGNDISPMDPPEAYAPPAVNRVSHEAMHPFLRKFGEEHALFMEELKLFEETILSIQETGFTKELDGKLRHFFHFFDSDFVPHSQIEETTLFPLLHKRLIADGEHSKSEVPTTAIDLMKSDHLKAVQLAAVILNFLGLAFRLPDEKSRLIVLDTALEQGKNLVELLRLHIFREDNIVFSSAHRLISGNEFDQMKLSVWNRT
ncbi:MAG: hemerythrin domain-containing protein [Deltaproteobacteria bacterium]|nr:hemerythrin domain-containing protein [Deltaproteobacteria bacterium]